jgi:hypothetical protein
MNDNEIITSLRKEISEIGTYPVKVEYDEFASRLGLPKESTRRLIKAASIGLCDLGCEVGDAIELRQKWTRPASR